MLKRFQRAWLFALILITPAWGQGHKPATAVSESDPAAVERGQAQFKSSCGFCHGEDATGSRAPDLVRSSIVAHDEQGSLLAPTIRNGRPDQGMPAFPALSDKQVADIIAFLHHQAYEASHSAHVPGNYPVAKLLTGNAEAGKAFFLGDGGCSGCHSLDGDLKGIASRMNPIDLQQAIVYPNNSRAPKPTATVTLKDGTRYEGKILHQDEFRISIMAQDGWYRSFAVPDVTIAIHDPLEAHRALTSRYTDADIHNLFAFLEKAK
ncbi:MAG TPA: c-type cytochrome [Bryobacteraceae bacterium]|jgi:cytochrome c oxidase cbb3-type subunit 3|nr:c-type cytochrome [Bryobacteraceae bacterium]